MLCKGLYTTAKPFKPGYTCPVMHELSIIQNIIAIAEEEAAAQAPHAQIDSIELHIGEMAGVEIDSLEFLWTAAVDGTVLQHANCTIQRIPGQALCADCQTSFFIQQRHLPCPNCGSHWLDITGGEELRVKSIGFN
jgi:hydrogenase nickel incorporation protein HypA/HybF